LLLASASIFAHVSRTSEVAQDTLDLSRTGDDRVKRYEISHFILGTRFVMSARMPLRLAVRFAVLSSLLLMMVSRRALADDDLAPSREPQGSSWISVSGFVDHRALGNGEMGAMASVGVALDRAGPALVHAQERIPVLAVAPPDSTTQHPVPRLPISRDVARGVVAAAWRASGVGADDERLDAMITRARISAILPETRLRVMRRIDDELDEVPADSRYYYPDSVDTWLEARFTWRLDRLMFVDEEPGVERLRIDRSEARMRIATRVLAVLAEWQRAWVDLHTLPADAPASLDGTLRMADAEATLDVFTAGWFSRWRSHVAP
jgi:hypothetical protein